MIAAEVAAAGIDGRASEIVVTGPTSPRTYTAPLPIHAEPKTAGLPK